MLHIKNFLLSIIIIIVLGFNTVVSADTISESISETYTVTFMEDTSTLKQIELNKGETIKGYPTLDSSEKLILGWVVNGKKISDPSSIAIEEDTVLTVWKAPYVNLSTHNSYINGSNGQFRPNDSLTRAEFCVIFESLYNIFDNNCLNLFSDVLSDAWYYDVVSKIISAGIMSGYDDGTFRPNDKMSRAEFISVLCCGEVYGEGTTVFSDTENHWAKNEIAYAYEKGWITMDSTNKFRPDQPITRAEAVVIFNRVLGRSALLSSAFLNQNRVSPFCDVDYFDSYYTDIMEATVEHTFTGSGHEEIWKDFSYKKSGYAPGINTINGNGYFVDANGQFCLMPAWSFVDIDGKTYFTTGEGAINLSFKGLIEIYGSLYCFSDDGSILKDGYFGNMYFGKDGKYTSGNAEIDAYVDYAIANWTVEGTSNEQKLYSAYIFLRDNSKYLGRAHFARGATDFAEECALFMFKNNLKGNCYCFASAFLYIARRLGFYDANVVSGGSGENNINHAWVMINSNIYDVQLEYAYLYQYSNKQYFNLFNLPVDQVPFQYHFPS